jgi:hypothetical protein
LPQNSEELRARLTLLGTAWIFAGIQQTNRECLKGLHPQVFQDYLEYLLGENVYGLVARGGGIPTGSGPSWQVILNYEFEIRAKAYRLMQKGSKFKEALVAAYEDPVVKERCFTTPLAWEAMGSYKRKADKDVDPPFIKKPKDEKTKGQKGKGAGGKGDKGKKNNFDGITSTTKDGRKVCFDYNRKEKGCDKRDCKFLHVCGRCTKAEKPMHECPCKGKKS